MLRTSFSLSHSLLCSSIIFRCLTMFQNETTNKFAREIPLEHVTLQLNTDGEREHFFEMRIGLNFYYCGCKGTQNRVRESLSLSLCLCSSLLADQRSRSFVSTRSQCLHADSSSPSGLQQRGQRSEKSLHGGHFTLADARHQRTVQAQSDRSARQWTVRHSLRRCERRRSFLTAILSLFEVIAWQRTEPWRSR